MTIFSNLPKKFSRVLNDGNMFKMAASIHYCCQYIAYSLTLLKCAKISNLRFFEQKLIKICKKNFVKLADLVRLERLTALKVLRRSTM